MEPNMEEYKAKVKGILDKLIIQNPDHSAFTDVMKTRLLQCGWREEVKLECNKVIQRQGNNLNVNEVIEEVIPIARAKVPTELKKELVAMLREALIKEMELNNQF